MRIWMIIGLLLTACTTPNVPVNPAPTASQRVSPTDETLRSAPPTPELTPIPDISYRYVPSSGHIERITDGNVAHIAQNIAAQVIVANQSHDRLAIRTVDDATIIYDVTSTQQFGPFDACDSMTWAPDTTNLWCLRNGHIYTIATPYQTDQLTIMAPAQQIWNELMLRPRHNAYWMLTMHDAQQQLCQYDHIQYTLTTTCIATGAMIQWAPNGERLAYLAEQRLVVVDASGQTISSVGLGDLIIVHIAWINQTHIALHTPERSYTYQLNDARMSQQASDGMIVGR